MDIEDTESGREQDAVCHDPRRPFVSVPVELIERTPQEQSDRLLHRACCLEDEGKLPLEDLRQLPPIRGFVCLSAGNADLTAPEFAPL